MKLTKRYEIEKPETYNLHIRHNHNYIANNLVISNCHTSNASVLFNLLTDHGRHIVHRFGLTGTLPNTDIERINAFLIESILNIVPRSSSLIEMHNKRFSLSRLGYNS